MYLSHILFSLVAKYRTNADNYLRTKLDLLVNSRHPDAVITRYTEIVKELERQSFYIPILDSKTLFDQEFYTLLCTRRQELIDNGTLVPTENPGGFAVKYMIKRDIRKTMKELKAALIIRCVIHHRAKNGKEPLQDPWDVE